MIARWRLVAGLRRVPLLDGVPLFSLPDVLLFTSLLGGKCAVLLAGSDSMGTAEPWEILIDAESGPTLDRGLLLRELGILGIVDNLLIQDPLYETDSLLVSPSSNSRGAGGSPWRKNECLLPLLLCIISLLAPVNRW